MTEVRFIESDLPPIMAGIIVHVPQPSGRCIAGVITELLYRDEAHIELFLPPGAVIPYRDHPYRFEPGGQINTTFHRLLECPALSQSAMMGTWPPAVVGR